jgi:ABC-2 type transport system permease protein
MSRIWLIGRHHFLQEATKRSFLILLFALPGFIALTAGLGYLFNSIEEEDTTLGYVDPAGFLQQATVNEEKVHVLPYPSESSARAALEDGELSGYYLLAGTFAADRRVTFVYNEMPAWDARAAFLNLVRQRRVQGLAPDVARRALEGPRTTVYAVAADRTFLTSGPTASQVLPLIVAAMYAFLILTTSGYMMEVFVHEKDNRTMEIMLSSVSASKMMAGKILGALGIAAVQLLVWVLCLFGAVWVGRLLDIAWLQNIDPNWSDLLKVTIVAIPSYVVIVAVMTTIGATLVDSEEAQQVGPLLFLLLLLPIYLIGIASQGDNPVVLFFTFFPPTSVTMVGLRAMVATVPWWQVAVSAGIGLLTAAFLVWLAGRALRLSMLRYGQRLHWEELLGRRRTTTAELARSGRPS